MHDRVAVIAVYTLLSRADLEAVAAAFQLQLVSAVPEPKGSVNTLYRLETDRGAAFLRVNEGKTEEDVRYEAALVAHLTARGVPTPPFLATRAGEPLLVFAGRPITVIAAAPGRDPCHGLVTAAKTAAVGEALGRLHRVARDFPRRRTSRYAFERIVERLADVRAGLHERGGVDVEALAAVAVLEEETGWLRARRANGLPEGVIHGDLFRDNVLFEGERLTALLDFEQASDGTLAYDLAVALDAWCFGAEGFDAEPARALVAGYQAARPLDAAERAALYAEARAAAHRFTVTRLTDFHLRPAAGGRVEKDYRRFLRRLRALRDLGATGFAELTGVS